MASTLTLSTANQSSKSEVIQINSTTQLPIKLNKTNFPSWYLQFDTLLTGLDLLKYVDGSYPCPPQTTTSGETTSPNPAYQTWIRQDKLILHSIIASVTEPVVPLIATAKTSLEAMTKLHNLFASKTRSRIMSLKKKLFLCSQGNKSVTEFLQSVRSIADELALAQAPVAEDDLIIFLLNGLGTEFREIATAIRARESADMILMVQKK